MDKNSVRIGIIGCGEVCEHKHLRAMKELRGARVTALADPNEARARHVAARYGIPRVFEDARALVESGEVDVVGVLTPPGSHREAAVMAMEAGLPVLVEKPLTLTMDDADALIDASSASGTRALMGLHMRWHRLIRRARDYVRSGELGAIESIRSVWYSPRPDRNIPGWKTRRVDGGGCLVEIGVHLFDLWRFLLDDEVEEVFALARHGVRDDENATVTATMAGGALATAHLSERTGHALEIEICGSAGRLRVECLRFDGFETFARHDTNGAIGPRLRGLRRFVREFPRGVAGMRRLGDYGDSYLGEWTHFLDAVRRGTPMECTLEDGREALRLVLAATASATNGEPIRVSEAPRTITPAGSRALVWR
jgi:myo-inositol 2-dehydrogenase / D-chiro-inositol 1-dehydrogenase